MPQWHPQQVPWGSFPTPLHQEQMRRMVLCPLRPPLWTECVEQCLEGEGMGEDEEEEEPVEEVHSEPQEEVGEEGLVDLRARTRVATEVFRVCRTTSLTISDRVLRGE